MIDIDKLPKHRKEWLEVFSLPAKQTRVMPGTCDACVWGLGEHTKSCASRSEVGRLCAAIRGINYELGKLDRADPDQL